MASPFSIFRKHQRVMMAVLGVAAMIAFVFLGPLQELMSQRGLKDPVVATSDYGKIRESDMAHMQFMRNLANRFMQKAGYEAQLRVGDEVFGEPTERALVQTMLLANKAKHLGVVISDQFITDWLQKNLQDRVTSKQYEGIVASLQTSRPQVYEALRTELLANQMVEMFLPGFRGGQSASQEWAIFMSYNTTPAQRWEFYQRLKRKATVEALAVSAADFIGEIADPSDDTVAAFYEKYKDAEPRPGAPDPGFKIPQKVKLSYFDADKKNFIDLASVSEQEIKDYYEKQKSSLYTFDMWSRFAPQEKPLDPPPDPVVPPAEKGDAPAKPGDAKPADNSAEKKAEEKKPADAPKTDAPKADAPKTDAPKSDPPKSDGAMHHGNTNGLAHPASMLAQLLRGPYPMLSASLSALNASWEAALFADDPVVAQATAPATGDKATGGKSEADKKAEPAAGTPAATPAAAKKDAPAAEKTDAEKSKAAKAAPEKSAPEKSSPEKSAPEKPAAEQKPLGSSLSTAAPPDAFLPLPTQVMVSDDDIMPLQITDFPAFLPLSYVAPSIREALAEQNVSLKMQETLDALSAKIKRYGSERTRWEVRRLENTGATPPQALDLKALAEEFKLTLRETDLLAPYEVFRLPGIGETFTRSGDYPRFVELVFSSLPLFTPALSFDRREDHVYLFWKTESHEARVPEFDEIRGEVVRTWKLREARGLAMKRAEALAAEARKDGRPLKGLFGERPGMQVIETEPFSWVTQESIADSGGASPPKLTEVPGIVDAGNTFMQKVFSLHVGDVGVAFNNPETIAYVIRPTSFQPTTKLLEDLFMMTPLQQYSAAAAFDRQEMLFAWNEAIQKEANLDWKRPAYPGRRGQ